MIISGDEDAEFNEVAVNFTLTRVDQGVRSADVATIRASSRCAVGATRAVSLALGRAEVSGGEVVSVADEGGLNSLSISGWVV